jgi:hypothetical protein
MRRYLVLLLAAAACGDDGSHQLPDAPPPPDAAIDAAPDAPVTLTITVGGEPVEGIDVYFLNPDNSLAAKVATNAQGVASAIVEAGGSVTAVDPAPPAPAERLGVAHGAPSKNPFFRTFAGVKPGDALQMAFRGYDYKAPARVMVPIFPGADSYEVHSSCAPTYYTSSSGSASSPEAYLYYDRCDTITDIIVEALSEGTKLAWFHKSNLSITSDELIDLTGETYAEKLPEVTFTVTNIPSSTWSIDYDTYLLSNGGTPIWERTWVYKEIVEGTATDTFPRVPVANTTALFHAYLWSDATQHRLLSWGASATTASINAGARMLPSYETGPELDFDTNELSWTATQGQTPDFVFASIYVAQGKGPWYDWEIVAPYDGPSVTFPKLPDGVVPFVPDQDTWFGLDRVVTAKVSGGYDAVRPKALDALSGWGEVSDLVSGPSGQIELARYQYLALTRSNPSTLRAQLEAADRAKRAARQR